MSVATYLDGTARSLLPGKEEKEFTAAQIVTLRSRLMAYFGGDVRDQLQFGSSTRETKLPGRVDSRADVDYMIVFDNTYGLGPHAFRDRLNRFAQRYYSLSEIWRSHPTVVLRLGDLMFDLVPARRGAFDTLSIPAPASSFTEWIETDPIAFNATFAQVNRNERYHIRPLIRLLKYWNARVEYPYDSYFLEEWIVARWFSGVSTLKGYFYDAVASLPVERNARRLKVGKIQRAKDLAASARTLEEKEMLTAAEAEIRNLLPPL
ncbi:MAG TPA: hypothetical protein VMM18_16500 [Gemmatimonadaceae bacterium]|nr:hypothetical protein [Gemmatimonadaceae bacterium]